MRSWIWIPNVNAWLSAIVLGLMVRGLQANQMQIWRVIEYFARLSPRLGYLVIVFSLLSPILLIAVAHHLLHLFLDRFFPDTRSPEIGRVEGFIPTLMSWWEGLYSWLVICLATLVTTGILSAVSPSFVSVFALLTSGHSLVITAIAWLVSAACLYQLEHVVRQHLISVGAARQSDRG